MRASGAVLGFVVLAAGLAASCACDARVEERRQDARRPHVVVQVLDGSDGEPVAGARLVGPRGVGATTGANGRAELDFEIGDEGELSARADDGRSGAVQLRRLRPGFLDVVIHVQSR